MANISARVLASLILLDKRKEKLQKKSLDFFFNIKKNTFSLIQSNVKQTIETHTHSLNKQPGPWLVKFHSHTGAEEVPIVLLWLVICLHRIYSHTLSSRVPASCGSSHSCQHRQLASGIGFMSAWRCLYSLTQLSESTHKCGRCSASGGKKLAFCTMQQILFSLIPLISSLQDVE